jgi:hypothetical protein
MKKPVFCVACLAMFVGLSMVAQECKKTEYTADQQKYMEAALQKFSACTLPMDNACRTAVAEALEHIYGVRDFGAAPNYMTPAEIGRKVAGDSNWEHLGSASDQNALKTAQEDANCGRAVVAVLSTDTGGHVAIILPGKLAPSGAWKLDVPAAASFFTHNPQKSFAGKKLSYSFPSQQGVEIYARK